MSYRRSARTGAFGLNGGALSLKKKGGSKSEHAPSRLLLAAMGMEAEFSLVVDGEPIRPEACSATRALSWAAS